MAFWNHELAGELPGTLPRHLTSNFSLRSTFYTRSFTLHSKLIRQGATCRRGAVFSNHYRYFITNTEGNFRPPGLKIFIRYFMQGNGVMHS